MMEIRGLSLTQPWAQLVAIGQKRVETRSWNTSYRGLIAIQAALKMPLEAVATLESAACRDVLDAEIRRAIRDLGGIYRGSVVAVARLVTVLPIVGDRLPDGERCVQANRGVVRVCEPSPCGHALERVGARHEAAFGDYRAGRFAWLLDDIRRLDSPVPVKGRQGLWWLKPDEVEAIERALHGEAVAS